MVELMLQLSNELVKRIWTGSGLFLTFFPMTKRERRTSTAAFKAKVVLEALKERHTLSELAQKHELHPNNDLISFTKDRA